MSELKIPSLLQVARNLRATPEATKKALIASAKGRPSFSYNPLYASAWDICSLGVSYRELEAGYFREKRPDVRAKLLEILPLLDVYFREVRPASSFQIDYRAYNVSKTERIPLVVPFVYGADSVLQVPIFLFWRTNTLNSWQTSLLMTLAQEIFEREPDFDDSSIRMLDFSALNAMSDRRLQVVEARSVPRMTHAERDEALLIFTKGFELAQAEWRVISAKSKSERKQLPEPAGQFLLLDAE